MATAANYNNYNFVSFTDIEIKIWGERGRLSFLSHGRRFVMQCGIQGSEQHEFLQEMLFVFCF